MASFDQAVELVLAHEGGYVNDAQDPGGETNFGISKRAYPQLDVQALTRDDAKAIYKRDYWRFDDVADQATANKLLDLSVNMGLSEALSLWGIAQRDREPLVALKVLACEHYFKICLTNPKATRFLHGWLRRVIGS